MQNACLLAQINVLPTFQATGIKLKLLMALYTGRHCIVNQPMVDNTGLEELCSIQNTAEEMKPVVAVSTNTVACFIHPVRSQLLKLGLIVGLLSALFHQLEARGQRLSLLRQA